MAGAQEEEKKPRPKNSTHVCAVPSCKSPSGISYHVFPKDDKIRKMWILACKRSENIPKSAMVCANHFLESDYIRDLKNELLNLPTVKKLKPGSVPSQNLCSVGSKSDNPKRRKRLEKRERKKLVESILLNDLKQSHIQSGWNVTHQSQRIIEKVTYKRNMEIQCSLGDDKALINRLQLEKTNLKNKLIQERRNSYLLKKEILKLKSASVKEKIVKERLLKNRSEAQVKKIMNPKQQRFNNYTEEDVVFAIVLKSISPKAYNYLKSKNVLALPSPRTQERWLQKYNCNPGFQFDSMRIVQDILKDSKIEDRFAIISIDEMNVKAKVDSNSKSKRTRSLIKMPVFMVRGLIKNWKQACFYDFDCPITKDLLFKVILLLEEHGIIIFGITFDINKKTLISQLNLSETNNYFPNPIDESRNIFAFPDVPHLLRQLRDHILDNGLQIQNGGGIYSIHKNDFEHLFKNNQEELKSLHKITDLHINCTGSSRRNIKLAAQLLSRSVATAFSECYSDKMVVQADAILTINDWFDILNSYRKFDAKELACGFGVYENKQLYTLEKMKDLMYNCIFETKTSSNSQLTIQRGILMSINSSIELYQYLRQERGIEYILMSHTNLECLKNFFVRIRSMSRDNSLPTPLECVNFFRILQTHKNEDFGLTHQQQSIIIEEVEAEEVVNETIAKEICNIDTGETVFEVTISDKVEETMDE